MKKCAYHIAIFSAVIELQTQNLPYYLYLFLLWHRVRFLLSIRGCWSCCSCQQVKAVKHYSGNDCKAQPDVKEPKGGSTTFLQARAKPESLLRSASCHSCQVLIAEQVFVRVSLRYIIDTCVNGHVCFSTVVIFKVWLWDQQLQHYFGTC